ncbi:Spo11/DNA topoisomerase VI subunit A [Kipferlia bialata]|uniref:DNA topoisomerase (ATP-hydrolyzing) n=1 Tax=Kipferlia bialata TaxID=797122 RepID=A0A9K3CTN0_9EUKA|nr:Spo11/DNA topoisomerase VI subunit A [Kipferlia bialata]|eukprot:g4343.t1
MRHWVCIYLVLLGLFAASASTFSCPNADVSFGLEPDTYICPTHATGGYEYQWLQPKSDMVTDLLGPSPKAPSFPAVSYPSDTGTDTGPGEEGEVYGNGEEGEGEALARRERRRLRDRESGARWGTNSNASRLYASLMSVMASVTENLVCNRDRDRCPVPSQSRYMDPSLPFYPPMNESGGRQPGELVPKREGRPHLQSSRPSPNPLSPSSGTVRTQRSFYYQRPDIFQTQSMATTAIDLLEALLRVPRHCLGITCTAKGLIAGNARFHCPTASGYIDLSPGVPLCITADLVSFHRMETRADAVLVVEKDTVFSRLVHRDLCTRLNIILLTGKGFPDTLSKIMVAGLARAGVPVLGLADADPYGVSILLQYMKGAHKVQHTLQVMGIPACAPSLIPIGVFPCQVDDSGAGLPPFTYRAQVSDGAWLRLSDRGRKRARVELRKLERAMDRARGRVEGEELDEAQMMPVPPAVNQILAGALRDMMETSRTCEIEALDTLGLTELADRYLPVLIEHALPLARDRARALAVQHSQDLAHMHQMA